MRRRTRDGRVSERVEMPKPPIMPKKTRPESTMPLMTTSGPRPADHVELGFAKEGDVLRSLLQPRWSSSR